MGVSSTPSTLLAQRNRAANSTLATAKALGTFPPGNRKFRDAIGRGNPSDFFRLEVTENSRIKLFLTNRSSNAITGAILNQRGQVINLNGKRQLITLAANQQSNTLLRSAAPGIYYLRFTSSDTSKTNYEVNLFVNRKGGPAPLPCGCEG
jgi:hypothetical protein